MIAKYNVKIGQNHPFKRGVRSILETHLPPQIASRFELYFEVEMYHLDEKRTQGLINQKKEGNYVCEVHYRKPSGLLVYITDVCSWWGKKDTEFMLLKFITDKLKTNQIGEDWGEYMSKEIKSGDFETPDEEITKYMVETKTKGGK